MKKFGLALGVGAARGFTHLGVLQALEENGLRPDYIAGASMGSLVGGVYALNGDIEEVEELVDNYRKSDLYIIDLAAALLSPGVARDSRFVRTMSRVTEGKKIENCLIPFRANAVDLVSGKQVVFQKGELWQAIRASCSIPGVLAPFELNGMYLVDGGLLNRVPVDVARGMGADIVVGVDARGDISPVWKPKTVVDVISRSFEVVDIDQFQYRSKDCDLMLTPSHDSVDSMSFCKRDKAISVAAGRKVIQDNLARIRELLED